MQQAGHLRVGQKDALEPLLVDEVPQRHRLLLICSSARDRKLICTAVGGSDFDVFEASSAESGLSVFEQVEPDCIIVEQELPNCSGLEFLQRLQARGQLSGVPVVVMSAEPRPQLAVQLMKAGASEFLSKREVLNIRLKELLRRVMLEQCDLQEQRRLEYSSKLASLVQLVAGAAHEINNPATVVRLTLSAVNEAIQQEASGSQLEAEEAERLAQLLDSADLALERIANVVRNLEKQTGTALGQIQEVSLNQVVQRAKGQVESLLQRHETCAFYLNSERRLFGDEAQLSGVLLDLVQNAVEALDGEGRIEVSSLSFFDCVELHVDDDGPGIEPKDRFRIFDPLYTTRFARGALGMGLARASAVVERHRGNLFVTRSPLGGARFIVRLPLTVVEAPEHARPSRQEKQSAFFEKRVRSKILVVDDDASVRDSYRRVLCELYDVDVAPSAAVALEMVESDIYDVILCDVIMPEQDGVGFARQLAEKYPGQAEALMFCSGGVLESKQERFLSGWNNGYLRKPLSAQQLKLCLASFLESRHAFPSIPTPLIHRH